MTSNKSNYAAFASFLNSYPDLLAIKRFRELQIRNLLFYQAELAHLEAELHNIEAQDAAQKFDTSDHANFRWTPRMAQDGTSVTTAPSASDKPETPPTPRASARTTSSAYCEKMLEIRRTLTKFDDAVEQYKRLDNLPTPKRRDMMAIHDWLNDMNLGSAFLAGDVEDVWTIELGGGKSKAADVTDFYGFQDQSGLTFYIGSIVAWFHRLVFRGTTSSSREPHHIDTSTYGLLDQALTTVIASLVPVLPIVVLYFVKNLLVRIGLIFAFTAIFSAVLVVGLGIKPHATLAITTALAAIQVVYVGSTSGDDKS